MPLDDKYKNKFEILEKQRKTRNDKILKIFITGIVGSALSGLSNFIIILIVPGIILVLAAFWMLLKIGEPLFSDEIIFLNLYRAHQNLELFGASGNKDYKELAIKNLLKILDVIGDLETYKAYYYWKALDDFKMNAKEFANLIENNLLPAIQTMPSLDLGLVEKFNLLLSYFCDSNSNSLKLSVHLLKQVKAGKFKRENIILALEKLNSFPALIEASYILSRIVIAFLIVFVLAYTISIFYNYPFTNLIPYIIGGGATLSAALIAIKIKR